MLCFVALVAAGCSRSGHYGDGFYQAPNSRWHSGYYTIRRGDTLYSIAFMYGYDHRQLARWNGIRPPYNIYVGKKLRLTPPPKKPSTSPASSQAPTKNKKATTATKKSSVASTQKPQPTNKQLRWRWPTRGRIVESFDAKVPGKSGIDISGKSGQPVYAAERGSVVYAGSGLRGYGKLIILKHNSTYFSAYAHNSRIRVKEDQSVKKGQQIADMGSSGANRTMLHFEIRRNGVPVNPLKYLPKH
jgi:lipoprotein NlpD